MSIATPSSTASAYGPEGNTGTATQLVGAAPQVEAPGPEVVAPAPSAASVAAASLPITNPGVDVITVAEMRRKAMLDALDPGPRPESAAKPSRRSFLSRVKTFYAQELTHDTQNPENNG
ncbi:hypothetical protein P6B95_00415 [Streptomyces atratus]|uniref:hypothetical protein n=1 Tax=Streptomyces atratus TaxID=1893 RepID=UPI002AC331FE|nr:hypothetical protein [Streptomyces atratus]WPW26088.1 hypothetical protein P6B95_00415 [Streptomyces atratus]